MNKNKKLDKFRKNLLDHKISNERKRLLKDKRVVMLVANDCASDARVIREAEAAAEAGLSVIVICFQSPRAPHTEKKNGVLYRRVPQKTVDARPAKYLQNLQFILRLIPSSFIYFTFKALNKFKQNLSQQLMHYSNKNRVIHNLYNKSKKYAAKILYVSLRIVRLLLVRTTNFFKNTASKTIRRLRQSKTLQYINPTQSHMNYTLIKKRLAPIGIGYSPDIVHAHDLNTMMAAEEIANVCSAKLVFDSHEIAFLERRQENPFDKQYKKYWFKRYMQRADAVVTVSQGFSKMFKDWYRIPLPVVLYNTPHFEKASALKRDIRTDLGLKPSIPLAVHIGGINPRRGTMQLTQALKYCHSMHLACVGPLNRNFKRELQQIAVGDRTIGRLHLVEAVPPEEVVHYCATADLAVVPRLRHSVQQEFSMPNKLFEAAFSGLPILGGETKELADFLDRFGIGFCVDCTDPEAIGLALRDLYRHRTRYSPKVETLNRMWSDFGWSRQKSKLWDLYQDLITDRPHKIDAPVRSPVAATECKRTGQTSTAGATDCL